MIWFKDYSVEYLEGLRNANMGEHIGFEFLEIGEDFLSGRIPVDHRTTQPFGILHGGASCVLAETLGSVAAWMSINPETHRAVGLEINANHIRAVTGGYVVGRATALHIGRRTQVWQIDMREQETGKRSAISRITMAVIEQGTLSAQKEKIIIK